MNVAGLIAALPVIGIIAGLARVKFPKAPYIAAGTVIGVYVLYIGSMGIWAATCWDCTTAAGDSRADFLFVSSIFVGLIAGTTLLGVWLGARMMTMLRRLRRTWDELRGHPQEHGDAR